jgi:hypothetical protein
VSLSASSWTPEPMPKRRRRNSMPAARPPVLQAGPHQRGRCSGLLSVADDSVTAVANRGAT